MPIHIETQTYFSSVDGIGPMAMDVAWPIDGKNLPVVAVMAGYHGTRTDVRPTVKRLAGKGLLAVGIDMRGRNGALGTPDSGAVEIYDIVDALATVCRNCETRANKDTWHVVGYSGGGGNVLSAVTKFPGRFVTGFSFFGVSDYAVFYNTTTREDCRRTMEKWTGGTPDEVPERYHARSALAAAGNARWTQVHLFWDVEETQCPDPLHSRFKWEAEKQSGGQARVFLHQSQVGDANRWYHGYPQDHPSLIAAEDIFVPLMLENHGPIKLPPGGTLAVPGYVVTDHFEYWIADGRSQAGRIEYAIDENGKVKVHRI